MVAVSLREEEELADPGATSPGLDLVSPERNVFLCLPWAFSGDCEAKDRFGECEGEDDILCECLLS